MVATVGSISIDLSTNAAKFASGFKGAATTVEQQSSRMSKAVNGFAGSLSRSQAALAGFVGGIAGGLVDRALGAITNSFANAKQAISELDDIASNSRTVGLSTDSYQAFAFAAQQANVEQEGFNKALEIFAKNVGLANQGTGALYSGLKTLNPELLRSVLNATNQRDRLAAVADALHTARDETEKAALATTIFGKAGIDMVRVLDGGAAALDEMEKQAKELGIAFDKDLFQQIGPLDDKLNLLARVAEVQLKSALVNLGPVLVTGATAFADFAKRVNESVKAINAFAENPNLKTVADFLGLSLIPGGAAESINKAFTETAGSVSDLTDQIKAVEREIAETTKSIQELKGEDVDADTSLLERNLASRIAQVDTLHAKLAERVALNVDTSAAAAAISEVERRVAGFKASMDAVGSRLPTVHGGGNVDSAIMDDVEKAIQDDTKTTGAGLSRVERAVQASGESVAAALSYNVPAGGGYATGDSANSFKFSGLGSSSSWGGRRLTFGGGSGGGSSGIEPGLFGGPVNLMAARANGTNMMSDTSSLFSAGTAATGNVVNVVVKPVMIGERLSSQSRAEIKQAAAEGTNAALRSYNGRA